jgi:hypothetical protein
MCAGFLKTSMTDKLSHKYAECGAISPKEASTRIVKAVSDLSMESTGLFVAPMGSESLGLSKDALSKPIPAYGELPW